MDSYIGHFYTESYRLKLMRLYYSLKLMRFLLLLLLFDS